MIIWGSKGREREIGRGTFFCPSCKDVRPYIIKRLGRYFTLYFIPLFETKKIAEYIECQGCFLTFKPEVLQASDAFMSHLAKTLAEKDRGSSGEVLTVSPKVDESEAPSRSTFKPERTKTAPLEAYGVRERKSFPWKLFFAIAIGIGVIYIITSGGDKTSEPSRSSASTSQGATQYVVSSPEKTPTTKPSKILPRSSPTPSCLSYKMITLQDIGKELCVTGIVRNAYETNQAFFITFSNQPGAFYLLSYEWVFEVNSGSCVVAEGKVERLGSSPVIKLEYHDNLYKCP